MYERRYGQRLNGIIYISSRGQREPEAFILRIFFVRAHSCHFIFILTENEKFEDSHKVNFYHFKAAIVAQIQRKYYFDNFS